MPDAPLPPNSFAPTPATPTFALPPEPVLPAAPPPAPDITLLLRVPPLPPAYFISPIEDEVEPPFAPPGSLLATPLPPAATTELVFMVEFPPAFPALPPAPV